MVRNHHGFKFYNGRSPPLRERRYYDKRMASNISLKISPQMMEVKSMSEIRSLFFQQVRQAQTNDETTAHICDTPKLKLASPPQPRPVRQPKYPVKILKVWSYCYEIYAQADGKVARKISSSDALELLPAVIVEREFIVHYSEHPDLMNRVMSLIRRGPNCRIQILMRGFTENMIEFLQTLFAQAASKIYLVDVCSSDRILLEDVLNALPACPSIILDINNLAYSEDPATIILRWKRTQKLSSLTIVNMPAESDPDLLQQIAETMFVHPGGLNVHLSPKGLDRTAFADRWPHSPGSTTTCLSP